MNKDFRVYKQIVKEDTNMLVGQLNGLITDNEYLEFNQLSVAIEDIVKTRRKLRMKVEAKLIRGGFNPATVKTMMELNYEYASSKYTGVNKIAEVVSTIY